MIKFKKVRFKNFLSVGNIFAEFNLDEYKTTALSGSNGVGKSAILDGLTFALFGKSFRGINKPQLVNSINCADTVAEVEFTIQNNEWKIKRGLKPTIFEIYKNGEVLNRHSSVIDQQNWLEENVLKMNIKSFTQIVILGSSNFIPFMQMTPAQRREVIEDLLDIKIFTSMNNVLKENIKSLKDEINGYRLEVSSINEKINMQEEFIDEITKRSNQQLQALNKKINDFSEKIDFLQSVNTDNNKEIALLKHEIGDKNKVKIKLKKLNSLKGKLREKKSTLAKNLDFFKQNTVCPTCTQDIENSFRLNKIEDVESKLYEIETGYNEIEKSIKTEESREKRILKLADSISQLINETHTNNIRISEYQKQIQDIESEIQENTETNADKNIEFIKLDQLKEEKENIQNKILDLQEKISYYNYTSELLKDSGIKAQVIKNYIPFINHTISKYLNLMDFPINFSLNEEFEEQIISPIHENYTYSSFSEGERQRIDLSLLFTWRDLARSKNSINTNLLILDEVFDSSLDSSGISDFLKIIQYEITDCNIFVITHRENLMDKFQKVIKVEKLGNFSIYT
jgi:DNA repair exonuclease SbcCD ATPase subunit